MDRWLDVAARNASGFDRTRLDGWLIPIGAEPLMPTILRERGLRLYFVSHDRREPPHVHIERGGAAAKVWVEQAILARNDGFAAHELGQIIQLVRERRVELLEAWNAYFGSGRSG